MKWQWLLASLVLMGCATPRGVTTKPDVRPVIESHEKAQESVGKAQTHVTKIKESQSRVSESLRKATESLNKYTGTEQIITDAKLALKEATERLRVSQEYAAWADTELANAWRYEVEVGERVSTLSGQIDAAHKHEQELADWQAKYEPVIKQVNKWFGLGAIIYGVKKLAGNILILAAVLAVATGLIYALSFVFPFVGIAYRWVIGVFSRVVNLVRRK